MTDYKAKSEELAVRGSTNLRDGSYFFDNDTETLLAAQTYATLYLAEQQRIANLIAFVASVAEQVGSGAKPNDKALDRAQEAGRQVIEGLGL